MTLNLIIDSWLPVRRLSGAKSNVRPCDITSDFSADPVLALDFPRPDWNAAVTELLIGLFAAVTAPDDTEAWADTWAKPPSPEDIEKRLAPLAFAFNLGGDGPRCFQDLDPLNACEEKPITALLIDAPGENAQENNADLFVKRSGFVAVAPLAAAAALVTMQTFAPEGGRGYRTSLRGAGPLTTLPIPRRHVDRSRIATTLWDCQRRRECAADFRSKSAAPTPARRPPISGAFLLMEPYCCAVSSGGSSVLRRRERRLECASLKLSPFISRIWT